MLRMKFQMSGKIASANKIYTRGRNGGVFLAPEVRAYRTEVAPVVAKALSDSKGKYNGGLLSVKIEVHHQFYYKNGEVKRIDIDNFAKNIIDSIFPVINIDDKMIFDLTLKKKDYNGLPKCLVEIKELPAIKSKECA